MISTPELAELLARPDLALVMADINVHLRAEAEKRARFREEVPPGMKAEFINGEVITHPASPLRNLEVTMRLATLLSVWAQRRRLGQVFIEKAMITATRNDYMPDVVFFGRAKADAFHPDQCLLPMPDFAVEVLSPATEAHDRGIKLRDYAAHGVREYWVVDPAAEMIETYDLGPVTHVYHCTGRFTNRPYGADSRLRSTVVSGFNVPVRALFNDEANAAALAELFASPLAAVAG